MIRLIWAEARHRVVGDGRCIPWDLPEDLRHFRERTMGWPVVMGRRTWDTLSRVRPLPGRTNVVLTRGGGRHYPSGENLERFAGAELAHSVAEVQQRWPDCWVIGGETLWKAFLPFARRIVRTTVDIHAAGYVTAPPVGGRTWRRTVDEVWRDEWLTAENGLRYQVENFERADGPRYIWAPWPEHLVAGLNDAQQSGLTHPYTCPNRSDGHVWTSDLGVLTATRDGWVCPSCTYRQDHVCRPWP